MAAQDPWNNVKILFEFQFQDLDRRARALAEREESIAKRERELMILINNFQDERRSFETELMTRVRSGGGYRGNNNNYSGNRSNFRDNNRGKRYRHDDRGDSRGESRGEPRNNEYDPARPQYSNVNIPEAAPPPRDLALAQPRPTSPYYDPRGSPRYQSSSAHPSEV